MGLHRHWGSDEDLVRDVGMTIDPELQNQSISDAQPAPVAKSLGDDIARWQFPERQRSGAERSDDSLLSKDLSERKGSLVTPRRVSFFDVGGLLEESAGTSSGSFRRESPSSTRAKHTNGTELHTMHQSQHEQGYNMHGKPN